MRTGYGLARRMRVRGSKLLAGDELLCAVVVEPVLPRFEALDDRVRRLVIVGGRVLGGRGVAAAHVSALCAAPQMQPPTAAVETFYAAIAARSNARINAGRHVYLLKTV